VNFVDGLELFREINGHKDRLSCVSIAGIASNI